MLDGRGIKGDSEPPKNPPVRTRCSEELGDPDFFLCQPPCHCDHLSHREAQTRGPARVSRTRTDFPCTYCRPRSCASDCFVTWSPSLSCRSRQLSYPFSFARLPAPRFVRWWCDRSHRLGARVSNDHRTPEGRSIGHPDKMELPFRRREIAGPQRNRRQTARFMFSYAEPCPVIWQHETSQREDLGARPRRLCGWVE